ncbi:IS1182 family transposase [Pedobacter aquae]|uniref:IS1182 family transposase n=1 Tax=Pedobacter aquae TaxID=2605747 RepID=A0A5C0VFP5_9SPHI|nr:IS1182 family transposase [Pedobacter aquae]QEK50893.1 IS1182 family transposase [Pedobacter aquae]QEK51346.1 IS1182 family transposase [Pedobacter aquae]
MIFLLYLLMQGRKHIQPKIIYQVNINDLVPADNFYRKLEQTLDLNFLYKETLSYYGKEGQESIDPLVFFKICLVGYLNNINSDRQLIAFCANCLDVRWYLKYDLDEALPWHSTISRTRQLYGEDVFLSLFQKVLSLCIAKGMVRGKRQAIDSAYIKANASMDSLVEKEIIDDVEQYANELNEGSEYKVKASIKKAVERHHAWKEKEYKGMPGHVDHPKQVDENGNIIRPKYLSNHTHYSPTDPDAKISTKPGKARQLNYAGQLAVDDAHHVITAACASSAGNKDSQNLADILSQTIQNLSIHHIPVDQITADAGYSSGEALAFCEAHHIDAYIPNFGQYKAEREGFEYNPLRNQYECKKKNGNFAVLAFKGIKTDSKGYQKKSYRSSETDCKDCPLRITCCGAATKFKKIEDSIDKPYYDRMHQKLKANPLYAKAISKIRSRTVEPVLGTLINFMNLKRLNTRGMISANKHVLMSAMAYNLKKLMKFSRPKIKYHTLSVDVLKLNQHTKLNFLNPLYLN